MISILTIDVSKQAPSVYSARPHYSGVGVTEETVYQSIEDAIRGQAQAIPPDFCCFVEFTYNGLSTGTLGIEEAARRAQELTERLISLVAEERRVMYAT